MKGMIAGFNSNLAKDLDISYKFIFDEDTILYLIIKNKKANISYKAPHNIDTIINTSYDTWFKIAFEGLNGEDAFLDGLVKCEGNIRNYALLPELFNNNINIEDEKLEIYPKFNSIIWMNLALIPWIFYWVTYKFLSSLIISSFGIIYITLFITLLKPYKFKKLSKLETLTLLCFPTYHLLNVLNPIVFNDVFCFFILHIILILVLLFSISSKI